MVHTFNALGNYKVIAGNKVILIKGAKDSKVLPKLIEKIMAKHEPKN